MNAMDHIVLKLSGFEPGSDSEKEYKKQTKELVLLACPENNNKGYWRLLIHRKDGIAGSYTFQRVEHLIDFTDRYLRKNLNESRWM